MSELGEFFGNWWQEFASGGGGLAAGYWLRGVVSKCKIQFSGQFRIDVGNASELKNLPRVGTDSDDQKPD